MKKLGAQAGFSVLEVVLAAGLFVVFATGAVAVLLGGIDFNRLGLEQTIATQYAAEGLEAVRSVKNQAYTNLTSVNTATRGVDRNSGTGLWQLLADSTNTIFNSGKNYTRTVKIDPVQKDCTGNIVASGGTVDPNTKKVTSQVTWDFDSVTPENISLTSYLSDWRQAVTVGNRNGVLVYTNGGTTNDAIQYKTFNNTTGSWSGAAATADIDAGSTNRRLRSVRLFASSSRNEKVMISRHYNGTTQYLYAQVFNGSTWGNVVNLSSWNSTTSLDVRNFDGVYLGNGGFAAIYSNNTSTPQMRIWDGCNWGTASNMANLADNGSATPLYISASVRPGTNEIMAAFYGTAQDTNTQYYNGSSWTLHPRHATTGPVSREMIDFTWSAQNSLKGALVFPDAVSGADSRDISIKVFTADGSGSGSWSSLVESPTTGATIGALSIASRKGAEEFVACTKNTSDDIYCFEANSTPVWVTPTNNVLTTSTDNGNQRSFDVSFEASSGSTGIGVYSDNTAIPKLKKYNPSANTFDAAATNITTISAALETVRIRPMADGDDQMVLVANTNNDLFSIVWNGTGDALYNTPAGKALTAHGVNGSDDLDFWFDFAWDAY